MAGKEKNIKVLEWEEKEAGGPPRGGPGGKTPPAGGGTATIYNELKRGYTGKFDDAQCEKYSAEQAQRIVQGNFKRRGRKAAAVVKGG